VQGLTLLADRGMPQTGAERGRGQKDFRVREKKYQDLNNQNESHFLFKVFSSPSSSFSNIGANRQKYILNISKNISIFI